MFALCITLVAVLMATAQAAASDLSPRKPSLPQCGNLTLSWPDGMAPFTIQVIDVTEGRSITLHTYSNHVVWTISATLHHDVSFLVTDERNATTYGGPYEVKDTGIADCLCGNNPAARDEEMPRNVEHLPKRAEITLSPVSERDMLNIPHNVPSSKRIHHIRRKRSTRRAPDPTCFGL